MKKISYLCTTNGLIKIHNMKKVIFALLTVMICSLSFECNAQNNKALEKAIKKEYKAKMKEYKKGGWKIFGTSRTLEVELLMHYEALTKEGVHEIPANAESSSKNMGRDKLLMNACTYYAREAGQTVKGRIVEDMGSNITPEEAAEFEHFYEAFEAAVEKEIKGELKPSYTVYREVKKGEGTIFEFEAIFLVDEDAATQARIRAFENAARESEMALKYAEKISDFI